MRTKYGIAFTADGGLPESSRIVGWRVNDDGQHLVFDSYEDALEANDLGGWTGYVRVYPSGSMPKVEQ